MAVDLVHLVVSSSTRKTHRFSQKDTYGPGSAEIQQGCADFLVLWDPKVTPPSPRSGRWETETRKVISSKSSNKPLALSVGTHVTPTRVKESPSDLPHGLGEPGTICADVMRSPKQTAFFELGLL